MARTLHSANEWKELRDIDKLYNEEFDLYYSENHDVWLEDTCKDRSCDICPNRPEKPSECEKK